MVKKSVARAEEAKDPEAKAVIARQGLRYRILRLIYDLSEGSVEHSVTVSTINAAEKLSHATLDQVLGYLRDEKLIQAPEYSIYRVSLRHKGLVELEKAILHPSAGTEHFSSTVTAVYARNIAGHSKGMRITPINQE